MVFVLTHYLALIETGTGNSVIFVLLMLQRLSLSNTAAQIIRRGLIRQVIWHFSLIQTPFFFHAFLFF